MHLLQLKNLYVSFKTQNENFDAVKNLSLTVNKGETVALVGESGSGKSVTALSILNLLPESALSCTGGEILLNGKDLKKYTKDEIIKIRGNIISMIFQEPMTSLNPLHTIEKQIGEVIKLHEKFSSAKLEEKVLDLLETVGLDDAKRRCKAFPHELSGGQRQRVMIAIALANKPDLLIADEPTTALDVTIQSQILSLLKSLQKKLGMAMLLITHDLSIVKKMADKVCVMKNGEIIESSETKKLFQFPSHKYTKMLIDSEPEPKVQNDFFNKKNLLKSISLNVKYPIKKGILRKTIDNIFAVNDVTIDLHEGETLGIVGESGSGKTSLGLALLRLIKSDGKIFFDGNLISSLPSKQIRPLRNKIQIVFQDPYSSLSPRMSAREIVEEGLLVHNSFFSAKEREKEVNHTFCEVGLDPNTKDRYPHEFSGGQRQRIAIARAIILRPKLIVFDEPTSALDKTVQKQIVHLLLNLQKKHQLTYIFISHDLRIIHSLSDKIIVMKNGNIVESGLANKIFKEPQEKYTKELFKAAIMN